MKCRRFFLCVALAVVMGIRAGWSQTGEVRIQAGGLTGLGSGGSPVKPMISGSFSFVRSAFSFGPELMYAFGEQHILGIGVATRIQLSGAGRRPYLVGGLGGNYWRRDGYITAGLFTGSVGAGIVLATRGGMDFTVETRIHKKLQNYEGGGNWDFISIAGGMRLGW